MNAVTIPGIEKMIYVIRGQKVMLDSDLAQLYEVPTKAFNQAIRRNLDRFPDDFMFVGSISSMYKQIGNAVHPGVAGVVFQALVKRAIKIGQPWANSLDISNFNINEITIYDEETLPFS
jgi:hypothetical protein